MLPSPERQTKILRADSLLEDYLEQQQKQQQLRPKFSKQQQVRNHFANQTLAIGTHSKGLKPSRPSETSNLGAPNDQDGVPFLPTDQLPSIVRIQRKLLAFFYIYATLIVTLYLTYAIYCYYQHTSSTKAPSTIKQTATGTDNKLQEIGQQEQLTARQSSLAQEEASNFEQKLQLMERYIEAIALDLEETKARLREREKCACSMNCSFNGTVFEDGKKWQQNCDNCVCRAGKITCSARKCPKLECDNPVQLAGQCCPTCMKNCKLNKSIVKHGETLKLSQAELGSKKLCKCNDGMIKCDSIKTAGQQVAGVDRERGSNGGQVEVQKAHEKRLQYLRSIIGAAPQLKAGPQQPTRHPEGHDNNSTSTATKERQ